MHEGGVVGAVGVCAIGDVCRGGVVGEMCEGDVVNVCVLHVRCSVCRCRCLLLCFHNVCMCR